MKATTGFVSACYFALFGIAAASLSASVDAGTEVLAKDLNAARIPGKVAAVIWTVRTERCTLQVVFPNAARIGQAMLDDPKLKQQRPNVQVWLLKGDGSLIAPTQRAEPGKNNPMEWRSCLPSRSRRTRRRLQQPYAWTMHFISSRSTCFRTSTADRVGVLKVRPPNCHRTTNNALGIK
jgi:hypothetical protein